MKVIYNSSNINYKNDRYNNDDDNLLALLTDVINISIISHSQVFFCKIIYSIMTRKISTQVSRVTSYTNFGI